MKILVALDSFKGSLTHAEANRVAARGVVDGLRRAGVTAKVEVLWLSDGGEGTLQALSRHFPSTWQRCATLGPRLARVEAQYAVTNNGRTALLEMAQAAGLLLLRPEERNPLLTTTLGVGMMMRDAVQRGCRELVMGLGGSATTDAGMGMLAALGVRFYAKDSSVPLMPIGRNLMTIGRMDWSQAIDLSGIQIKALCDVDVPLIGHALDAMSFAAQKGATTDQDRLILAQGLQNFANLAGIDPTLPRTGAAGGLGYGLKMLGAELWSGAEYLLDVAQVDSRLAAADLILIGEGSIDGQTSEGKLPYRILQRANRQHVAVIALAGRVQPGGTFADELARNPLSALRCINPPDRPELFLMAPAIARRHLREAASLTVQEFLSKALGNTGRDPRR